MGRPSPRLPVARRRHHGPAEGSGGWQVLSLPLRVGTHRAVDAGRSRRRLSPGRIRVASESPLEHGAPAV